MMRGSGFVVRGAAIATACVVVGAQTRPSVEPARFARIATVVEEGIAQRQLPGAVVLVGRGDAVLYRHAFGQRAVAPGPEPMTEDTIFDLASLTKVVATTTSVM